LCRSFEKSDCATVQPSALFKRVIALSFFKKSNYAIARTIALLKRATKRGIAHSLFQKKANKPKYARKSDFQNCTFFAQKKQSKVRTCS